MAVQKNAEGRSLVWEREGEWGKNEDMFLKKIYLGCVKCMLLAYDVSI